MNDHVKQHYIPQFIIKNFCNTNEKTFYYDISNKKIVLKASNEIFEEQYLYEYMQNNNERSNIIESELSKFESVAASAIKPFLTQYSVSIDFEKTELIKYFFFIMMMRSKFMFSTYNKELLKYNQRSFPDITEKELDDFYKKNLEKLIKCRTIMDVVKDKTIDKQFVQQAFSILVTKHLVLFQPEGKLEFVLGDAYSIGLEQKIHPLDLFNRMSLVSLIFPISYKRAIGLVDTYDEFHDIFRQFKIKNKDWYKEPKEFGVGRRLIELKYMNDEDVANINNAILQNSKDGICFRSERKCGLKFS